MLNRIQRPLKVLCTIKKRNWWNPAEQAWIISARDKPPSGKKPRGDPGHLLWLVVVKRRYYQLIDPVRVILIAELISVPILTSRTDNSALVPPHWSGVASLARFQRGTDESQQTRLLFRFCIIYCVLCSQQQCEQQSVTRMPATDASTRLSSLLHCLE